MPSEGSPTPSQKRKSSSSRSARGTSKKLKEGRSHTPHEPRHSSRSRVTEKQEEHARSFHLERSKSISPFALQISSRKAVYSLETANLGDAIQQESSSRTGLKASLYSFQEPELISTPSVYKVVKKQTPKIRRKKTTSKCLLVGGPDPREHMKDSP